MEARLLTLKAQYDAVMAKRAKTIDELNQIKKEKTPEEEEYDEQMDIIRDLERQRANLGIFKGKEKKYLTDRIREESAWLAEMRDDAQIARDQHEADINMRIQEAQHIGQHIVDEYSSVSARLTEIKNELNKSR